MLSKNKVIDLLVDAETPFSEFETYYNHLQAVKGFDELVKISRRTLKK